MLVVGFGCEGVEVLGVVVPCVCSIRYTVVLSCLTTASIVITPGMRAWQTLNILSSVDCAASYFPTILTRNIMV